MRGIGVTTRRDQITIMSDLLEIVRQPRRLTHILYKSNMSYAQLSRYLEDMIDMGFIKTKSKPYRSYIVTPKGIQFNEMLSNSEEVEHPDSLTQ